MELMKVLSQWYMNARYVPNTTPEGPQCQRVFLRAANELTWLIQSCRGKWTCIYWCWPCDQSLRSYGFATPSRVQQVFPLNPWCPVLLIPSSHTSLWPESPPTQLCVRPHQVCMALITLSLAPLYPHLCRCLKLHLLPYHNPNPCSHTLP